MEQLMKDLLQGTSREKYDAIPPFCYSTLPVQGFIRDEDLRSEPSLFAVNESSNSKNTFVFETTDDLSHGTTLAKAGHVEESELSYQSFDTEMLHGTPSPPTYIPGDYHDISSDSPPVPDTDKDESRQNALGSDLKKRSFAIESLLGDIIDDTTKVSAPAYVVSHVPFILPEDRPQFADFQSQPTYDQETFLQARSNYANARSTTIYWCHVCAMFCSSVESADQHRYAHASDGVKCELKTAIFRQHGYVTVHENTGFLDRIKCGLCQKIICGRYFIKHVRVHNGHHCEICSKEFPTNSRLRDHLNDHTGELPYACAECPRRFSNRIGLTQHNRKHRNFRSFGCRFCDKRFNSKHTCLVHERIHTGNNPFRCPMPSCERSFPQKIQLSLHINTHM